MYSPTAVRNSYEIWQGNAPKKCHMDYFRFSQRRINIFYKTETQVLRISQTYLPNTTFCNSII